MLFRMYRFHKIDWEGPGLYVLGLSLNGSPRCWVRINDLYVAEAAMENGQPVEYIHYCDTYAASDGCAPEDCE